MRECFGRVAYSHKTHEKCADILLSKLSFVKWAQIVLSALTTGGLITAILGDAATSHVAAIVSAVLSTILLALNTYTKESDPGRRAEKHKETASKLWNVRESYLSLLTDLLSGCSETDAQQRRDTLQAELAKIYETAPRTDAKAYGKAQEGLQYNEELTSSDDELDLLLPPALRR
jgi:ABC-type transport system involved in cytochrome bd biosynthesis fused ATPase/permease subunit